MAGESSFFGQLEQCQGDGLTLVLVVLCSRSRALYTHLVNDRILVLVGMDVEAHALELVNSTGESAQVPGAPARDSVTSRPRQAERPAAPRSRLLPTPSPPTTAPRTAAAGPASSGGLRSCAQTPPSGSAATAKRSHSSRWQRP